MLEFLHEKWDAFISVHASFAIKCLMRNLKPAAEENETQIV